MIEVKKIVPAPAPATAAATPGQDGEFGPGIVRVPDVKPAEIGGPSGPEPTRYGDWERRGRCIDF